MSIPLREKVQFLLLDFQTLRSPTFGFHSQSIFVAEGRLNIGSQSLYITAQADASEFPPEDSTPSCPLRDGLDLSSMRPQP